MEGYKINVSDILGSKRININTPIIFLTGVPKKYLISTNDMNKTLYNVDIDSLHRNLEKRFQFIDRFVPVGQVNTLNQTDTKAKKTYNMVMANTRIVPTTNNFEEIKKNIW